LQPSKEGESISAGSRRLLEEMGFKTELKDFHFIYKARLIMV
jgi:isopentenyl-diphosphate delta-isomerase